MNESRPSESFEWLRDDQRRRWMSGKPGPAEDDFAENLPILADRSAALELIYAEFCVREDMGEGPIPTEYVDRFPDYAEELQALFVCHRAMVHEREKPVESKSEAAGKVTSQAGHGRDSTFTPGASPAGQTTEISVHRIDVPTQADRKQDVGLTPLGRFGGYELLEVIARRGMGIVYNARQINAHRIVALKMILAGQFASLQDVKRFEAEASAAATLDHPNIVPVFEVGEHEGRHFYSMGFVDGQSLSDQLREGPLAPKDAARLVQQVAAAVEYPHRKGIVHRDLKPQNILLSRDGTPRVTDFGLAKQLANSADLTATGQILGTPQYISPEQARGALLPIDGPVAFEGGPISRAAVVAIRRIFQTCVVTGAELARPSC